MKLKEATVFLLGRNKHREGAEQLGDFTTTRDVIPITLLAIGIGIFSAFVALALLRLIGLFTNLFFYQRWSTALVSPAGNHLGWLEVLVPMIGGLLVGLMARYGSEAYPRPRDPGSHRSHSVEGWSG
jgi:H+/Cl- antiporter ClcA